MLDANTHALNQYLHSQEVIEKEFELSKQEKCYKIVEYAIQIMQGECTDREFEYTFGADDELGDSFSDALDDWAFGIESIYVKELALLALEAASLMLYDVELSEIAYFNESDWTNIMVDEVVNSGSNL